MVAVVTLHGEHDNPEQFRSARRTSDKSAGSRSRSVQRSEGSPTSTSAGAHASQWIDRAYRSS